jgi:type IV pilus assembly protein PilB
MVDDSQQINNPEEDEFLKEEEEVVKEKQAVEEAKQVDKVEASEAVKEPARPLYERMSKGDFDLAADGRIKPAEEGKEEALKEKMGEIELGQKEEELKGKATMAGLGYINLRGLPIMPEALKLIPEEESKKEGVICFMYKKDKEIRLAVLKKNNKVKEIVKRLKGEHPGISIQTYLTSQASIEDGLKMYAALPKIIAKVDEREILEADLEKAAEELTDLKDLESKLKDVSITEILGVILAAAIKVETSDIHIEAEEGGIQLRFRVDGVLHDIARLDKQEWEKLIARIKLNSNLKINIKDKPQDGHFSIHVKDKLVDFRVSTLPTTFGESVVMRILYHEKIKEMTLNNLGIEEYNRQTLDIEIEKPNGMIVVTGPTGAGKTTTLYAILNKLNQPENKIITVEDPIEYKIEGISQSEIRADKGYTFAKALRSVVRQDPDIILVGEVRDKETAEICLNAALTGHLVFTTLHTNDAAGTIPRLLSLAAKPYLLAPAINVSIAQRLVRRICEACKKEEKIKQNDLEKVKQELESLPEKHKGSFDFDLNKLKVYKGKGCDKCTGLGYKGQIGIFEVFEVTDEIRDMILSKQVSEYKLKEAAVKNGMITLVQDGLIKALKGMTSIEEVFRVS